MKEHFRNKWTQSRSNILGLLLFIVFLLPVGGIAQNNQVLDSLYGIWNSDKYHDTVRIQAMFDATFEFWGNDFDSVLAITNLIREEAARIKDTARLIDVHLWNASVNANKHDMIKTISEVKQSLYYAKHIDDVAYYPYITRRVGVYFETFSVYDSALHYYEKSIKLYVIAREQNPKNYHLTRGLANSIMTKADLYFLYQDYERTADLLSKAQNLYKESDYKGLESVYALLGRLNNRVKEYDKALEYSFKSLQLAKRDSVQGKFRFPGKYMNISLTYLNMGVEYIDSADLYMEQAIFWAEKTHNYYLIQGYYRQWANFHRHYGNMERFHELIEMAYNSRTSAIKKENMSLLLSDVGVSYYYLNKTSIGIKFCLRAKQIADSTGMNFPMKIANFNLYEIYNDMKLFDKALIHYKNFVYLTDSIKKEENQRAVIRNTFKHEYEKKALADSLEFAKAEELKDLEIEKQSAELSQQRIGLAATGVGLILIIALAASIHKGKKRSDELLLNILPEETAQELKAKGSAESKLIEDTTVLFTDFEGFTAMSENVTASALVKDINECFSAFDHIMEKHGVEKIKTIGDAYMAAGGLPTPNKTHVKDVVLAALEIADFMKDWAAKKEAKGKPHFDIRIGVNTGPVVAGIVGVKKFQYDIWGDTVNTASRMESASDVGKVNISESTYNKLKDEPQFAFDYRGEIEAKGKGKVKMWFVNRKNT